MLTHNKKEFLSYFRRIDNGKITGPVKDGYWRDNLSRARKYHLKNEGPKPALEFVLSTLTGSAPVIDVEKTLDRNLKLWIVDDSGTPVNLPGLQCPVLMKAEPKKASPKKNTAKVKDEKPESGQVESPEEDDEDYIPKMGTNSRLTYEKTRKEKGQADKLLQESVLVSEVQDKSFNFFRQLRDGIQSLNDRLSIKLLGVKTEHEISQIIKKAGHQILESAIKDYDLDDESVKKKLVKILT